MEEKIIAKEKEYLKTVCTVLQDKLTVIEQQRATTGDALVEKRRKIWESLCEMDESEQLQEENEAQLKSEHYVMLTKQRNLIENLLYSPFFGKIVFGTSPDQRVGIYIGLAQIDDDKGATYVVDWRAPVADLYYNHDVGKASYDAPMGTIKGEVYVKYQYKITAGELRYMVDTSTTILDEVLLAELGKNASPAMRNIAATIQREQNTIIRHTHGDNVLVLGVAGSGKTSIALHRIAYILYHCRNAIKASDVLIITPNKAFTSYIGNVLPELGEEMARQLSIEDIVREELGQYAHQSRNEHLERIYAEPPTEEQIADMRYKASAQFVTDIQEFAARLDKICFRARDFIVGQTYSCPKSTFDLLFKKRFAAYPALKRMQKIIDYVLKDMSDNYHSKLSNELQMSVRKLLMKMYTRYDLLTLYRIMLRDLRDKKGAPVMVFEEDEPIPYKDIFGFLLLKSYAEGVKLKGENVKHLVIDEMQDYTPVQYAFFNRLFNCPRTVLGDVNQMADPFLNIGDQATARACNGGDNCVQFDINTSYRSTYEIATYANRFTPNAITPIDRRGEQPLVMACAEDTLIDIIKQQLTVARQKGYTSVAIIARTAQEARQYAQQLQTTGAKLLLTADAPYTGGIVVTTAFAVKGFEFDQVIVANASDSRYCNTWDDRLLYISVTRALHRLVMLYTGTPSRFLGIEG
jgi:DNA helicase-2/ATP-dependent DNA helicase PcrA